MQLYTICFPTQYHGQLRDFSVFCLKYLNFSISEVIFYYCGLLPKKQGYLK